MRTLTRNKQTMFYAQLLGEEPVYRYDQFGEKIVDFVDADGTKHYRVTGNKTMVYSEPIEFKANISENAGDVVSTEFGIDNASYDASVVYTLNKFPITETSLVWFRTKPTYKHGKIDPMSADYKVASVKSSLNYTKLLLRKLVK